MARKLTPLQRSGSRKSAGASVPDYVVDKWFGTITVNKDPKKNPRGSSPDELNWITGRDLDHIELRMGTSLLGLTKLAGNGKITGLKVCTRPDGSQIAFFTHDRKVKSCLITGDWSETGVNLLPAAASGEDISIDQYNGLAGSFAYISSPNSSIYKIPTANPGSAVDQQSLSFRGYIRIKQNRTFLWNNKVSASGATDKTSPNLSYIDKSLLSQFTQITGESIGTGDGATKTFAGTLAARTGKRTVFLIQITDTNETFLDDKMGNLTGSLGGTGTINYATGAFSVTFNTAPANLAALTATYSWEDATSTGICDFSSSSPRTAGQGAYFPQFDGGGPLMNILTVNNAEYCIHLLKTWVLTLTANDTAATNLIYASRVGIPYWRATYESGLTIPYLDFTDQNNPMFRVMDTNVFGQVLPNTISHDLNLAAYGFNFAVVYDWSNYYILCCQNILNGANLPYNGVMFIYEKTTKQWNKLDYAASVLSEISGILLAGDSISNNVWQLFSGYDDDGQVIFNHWNTEQTDLGVQGRKSYKKFIIDGYIARPQSLIINAAYDNGAFTKIGQINGTDPVVDFGSGILVGSTLAGSQVIGDPGTGANAYHFRYEFTVASDNFEHVQFQFVAGGIGALQINSYRVSDIRYKGRKVSPQYFSN